MSSGSGPAIEVDDLVAENRKLLRKIAELDGEVALLYEFVRRDRTEDRK